LSTLALAMMTLMTNYPLLIERQVKRIKAQYVAEEAFWRNYMNYAVGVKWPPTVQSPIQENIDGITYTANVTYQAVPPSSINATVNY